MGKIVRYITTDGSAFVIAGDTTDMVSKAENIHKTSERKASFTSFSSWKKVRVFCRGRLFIKASIYARVVFRRRLRQMSEAECTTAAKGVEPIRE